MTNLHIKYRDFRCEYNYSCIMATPQPDGEIPTQILKIKVHIHGKKEKGWFLHKTSTRNTLKDVALEILSGKNECFPLKTVCEMLGINDQHVEFDTMVDVTAQVKDGSSWIESPMSMQLCDLDGMQNTGFVCFWFTLKEGAGKLLIKL